MSRAFITKVITPGMDGALSALDALKSLINVGKSVALIANETEESFLEATKPLFSDEPSLILLTGGSSMSRKAVEIPVSRLIQSAKASESVTGSNLLWVTALSPTSIAGANTMIRSILNGYEPAIWPFLGGVESFSAERFIPTLKSALLESQKEHSSVAVSLVPTQVHRLLESEDALDLLSQFAVVLVGGAKLNSTQRTVLQENSVRVIETYGATETSGGCVYDGIPLAGVNIVIEHGTVHIFGKTNALCYRDGTPLAKWNSQDVGDIKDGALQIYGRSDDVVKVAGIQVNVEELSSLLQTLYPDTSIAVTPIEDDEYGYRIIIFATKELSNLERDVASLLPSHRLPIQLRVLEELPLLRNGKVDIQTLKNSM